MSAFVAIVKRDLVLAMRRKNEVITSVFFFVVVAALFPLGIGPEMNTLRLVAPGILWVGALLASMLSLGRMFAADYADGTLEQMALSPNSLSMLVAAKILAHWLLSGLPLVLLARLHHGQHILCALPKRVFYVQLLEIANILWEPV